MIYGTVLCLGDSLTFGSRSRYGRGYPEELSKMLSEHFQQEWSCINESQTADTSIEILRRAFKEVNYFSHLPGAKFACLLVGTNDSKNPGFPIELYKDNMRQIIRIVRRHGLMMIVGTLPPVMGNCMPCFDSLKSNEWIKKANDAIQELIQEYALDCVELSDMGNYIIDGVHFNYEGYVEVARRFFEKIKSH